MFELVIWGLWVIVQFVQADGDIQAIVFGVFKEDFSKKIQVPESDRRHLLRRNEVCMHCHIKRAYGKVWRDEADCVHLESCFCMFQSACLFRMASNDPDFAIYFVFSGKLLVNSNFLVSMIAANNRGFRALGNSTLEVFERVSVYLFCESCLCATI